MTNTTKIEHQMSNARLASILATAVPVSGRTWLAYGEYDVPQLALERFRAQYGAPSDAENVLLDGRTITVKMRPAVTYMPRAQPLTLSRLAAALGELLSEGSYAAAQFVMGKEDASHADVILQQAVFGEVVYG